MDWMTLSITLANVVIFLAFIVVPIGEFREIFRAIRHKDAVGRGHDREGR